MQLGFASLGESRRWVRCCALWFPNQAALVPPPAFLSTTLLSLPPLSILPIAICRLHYLFQAPLLHVDPSSQTTLPLLTHFPNPLFILHSCSYSHSHTSNILAGLAGITSDANSLVNFARNASQRHLFTYNEDIPVELLVQRLCDMKQGYTQFGGESECDSGVARRSLAVVFCIRSNGDRVYRLIK